MTDSMSAQQHDHRIYEAHCALAATGQLSQRDRIALDTHCKHCTSCRECLLEMAVVSGELMLHAATDAAQGDAAKGPMPVGSLERFVGRAQAEGIALRSSPKFSHVHTWAPALSALTVFALMLLSMNHRRLIPTSNSIVANAIATSDVQPQPTTERLASPVDRHTPHRIALHAKHPTGTRLASKSPASSASQGATLAPERFSQAIPSAYSFFESRPAPPEAASYPALSRAQVLHLALFRNAQEPASQSALGIATLYRPDALFPADRSFDFAPGMRQLRFQLPTNP